MKCPIVQQTNAKDAHIEKSGEGVGELVVEHLLERAARASARPPRTDENPAHNNNTTIQKHS